MIAFQKTNLLIAAFIILAPLCSQSQISRETLNTKMGKVSFDKTITGFQFAAIIKERFVYSVNGKKDVSSPTPKTGFYIDVLTDMDDVSALDYIMQLTKQFGKPNLHKMSTTLKDSIIDIQGHKSYCSSFSVFDKNGKQINSMLIGAIPVGDKAIIFFGTDYSKTQYLPNFFKTFQSIKF